MKQHQQVQRLLERVEALIKVVFLNFQSNFYFAFIRIVDYRLTAYNIAKECLLFFNALINKITQVLFNFEGSHPFSLWLRPWLEHKHFRVVFGLSLIVSLFVFNFSGMAFTNNSGVAYADFPSGGNTSDSELAVATSPKNVVTTEHRYQMPVELIDVSQRFHRYHPGVDLRASYGSNIHPVTEGIVRKVIHSAWGYGQAIIVDHADKISSMYAHVGKIFVDPGSHIDQGTVIAEVGLTGSTTGPHLHLEIYQNGVATDPQPFLGY